MERVTKQQNDQTSIGTARTRPLRSDVRRQVLEAALVVFAQKGFDGASMDDIASAAGFTKGALYSNFASKDGLFLALMDQQVTRRISLIDNLLAVDAIDPAHVGDALTEAALSDRDWQLLFFEYWARAVRDPAIKERFIVDRRKLRQNITDVAQRLLDQTGRTSNVPVGQLTIVLLALSNGLAVEGFIDPTDISSGTFANILNSLTDEVK